MSTDHHQSIDSGMDSVVSNLEDGLALEDEDLISFPEQGFLMGDSSNDLHWDQRTALSNFSIRLNVDETDDVSELSLGDWTSDSTILSLPPAAADWLSLDTEIDVSDQPSPAGKQQSYSNTKGDAIRLELRKQRRSKVMAKMLRLEVSMQKLGVDLGYSSSSAE